MAVTSDIAAAPRNRLMLPTTNRRVAACPIIPTPIPLEQERFPHPHHQLLSRLRLSLCALAGNCAATRMQRHWLSGFSLATDTITWRPHRYPPVEERS